jgi:serine protease Do
MMNQGWRRLLMLLVVFVAAFGSVYTLRMVRDGRWLAGAWASKGVTTGTQEYTLPLNAPLAAGEVELLSRLNDEYARLTRAVVPSVVSVDTAGIRTVRQFDGWGQPRLQLFPVQEQGSGVIVTEEGHVVTNYHVIAGKQQLQVTLHNGNTHPARLVGEDRVLDIAVLKIEAAGPFKPLKFGDSDNAQVGQMVFAVGNPFGLGETVTQGILSARDRSLSDTQRDLLQTDAAINPGNSGGPLVSLRGEIIGINVAIFSPDRANPGFQGVGFSIPANDVMDSLVAILESGRPVRGFLGVGVEDLNSTWRRELGYDGGAGAVVGMVAKNSPAAASGLRVNDVIVRYGNEVVRGSRHLLGMVQRTKAGAVVELEVWRAGSMQTLQATIGEAVSGEASPSEAARVSPERQARVKELLGLEVRDLTVEEVLQGARGVWVTAVDPQGMAAGMLAPGDLLVGVNQRMINT